MTEKKSRNENVYIFLLFLTSDCLSKKKKKARVNVSNSYSKKKQKNVQLKVVHADIVLKSDRSFFIFLTCSFSFATHYSNLKSAAKQEGKVCTYVSSLYIYSHNDGDHWDIVKVKRRR